MARGFVSSGAALRRFVRMDKDDLQTPHSQCTHEHVAGPGAAGATTAAAASAAPGANGSGGVQVASASLAAAAAETDSADCVHARSLSQSMRLLSSRIMSTKRRRMVLYSVTFLILFCTSYSFDSRKRKDIASRPQKFDAYKANSSTHNSLSSSTSSSSSMSIARTNPGPPPHPPSQSKQVAHLALQKVNEALWSDLTTTTGGTGYVPPKEPLPVLLPEQPVSDNDKTLTPDLVKQGIQPHPLPVLENPNPDEIADEVEGFIQSIDAQDARQAAELELARRADTDSISQIESQSDIREVQHGVHELQPDLIAHDPGLDEKESVAHQFLQATESIKQLRGVMDEVDSRNLEALVLQATSGDCNSGLDVSQKKSLFKTDSDKATEDIDQSSALWGAWCAITTMPTLIAMQKFVDYVEYFDNRLVFAQSPHDQGPPAVEPPPIITFDDSESLDDNSTSVHLLVDALSNTSPDDIQARVVEDEDLLRAKVRVAALESLMDEQDFRFMTALFAQSTLGNCDKYSHLKIDVEHLSIAKNSALWGTWCALRKHHRSTTREEYMKRQQYFEEQKKFADEKSAATETRE